MNRHRKRKICSSLERMRDKEINKTPLSELKALFREGRH